MIKNYLIILVFIFSINFSTPVHSGNGAIALFESIVELIIKNISVIKGKLAYLRSEAKALINAEKLSSDTLVVAMGEIRKYSEKRNLKNSIGDTGLHVRGIGGTRYNVGAYAPSACIRSANNNISYDLASNVSPVVTEMKRKLVEMVRDDSTNSNNLDEKANEVASFIKSNKEKPLNPFSLDGSISQQQFDKLSKVISYIVNKNPPSSLPHPNKGGNSSDFHAKRLRYEEFVKVVQSIFINHIKYNLIGNKGMSEKDLLFRLKAKANSLTVAEAMVVKYKAGEIKELNGTFSDIIMVDVLNQKIKRDNLALLSLIATGATDELSKRL